MSLGIGVDSGPLIPGGALTYILYALMELWLVVVTTVIVVRLGKPPNARAIPATPEDLHGRMGPRQLTASQRTADGR